PQVERSLTWMKPVLYIDLFIGADIFTPGAIFGAAIIDQALALLPATVGQQPLDWHHLSAAIALATETCQAVVAHLPQVLYH
ncbi:glycosyl transferase, partial [Pseudomonas syringae pv. tagetis]